MPLDPSISLGVQVPQPSGLAGANPLTALSTLGELQLRMNQNQLFQQQFAAKQLMGQIFASAPNTDAAFEQIMKSPAAPFATDALASWRQMQHTMLQMQGEKQTQGQSALAATMKALGGAINDPGQLEPLLQAHLAVTSPAIAPEVRSGISSIVKSLGRDLPADPSQAKAAYQSRLAGMMLSSGWTPEALASATGSVVPRVEVGAFGPGGAPAAIGVGGTASAPTSIPGTINQLGASQPAAAAASSPMAGGPAAAGSPSGVSLSQQDYLKTRGEHMAKYQTELDDAVKNGNTLMQTIQEARDAQQNFKPGGGAGLYARLGQIAQGFGAPNSVVDRISNGDLSASQEFSKIANNFVVGQLRQALQGVGGSRINQMEWEAFSKNNPNLETDPRAVDKIFNFWTRQHNYNVNEQQALSQYLKEPGADITHWPATWQKIVQQQKMVNTSVPQAGGQRPEAAGADVQWEVKDGKLVRVPKP